MKTDGRLGDQNMNKNPHLATLLNPQTGKLLAQISLDEQHIQVNEVISSSGSLQGFTILSGKGKLHETWFDQKTMLLRTRNMYRLVKIATFPIDGEKHGHLEIIQGNIKDHLPSGRQHQPSHPIRRGFALLQTLIGT